MSRGDPFTKKELRRECQALTAQITAIEAVLCSAPHGAMPGSVTDNDKAVEALLMEVLEWRRLCSAWVSQIRTPARIWAGQEEFAIIEFVETAMGLKPPAQ